MMTGMSSSTDPSQLPTQYWHCKAKLRGEKRLAIVNDLSLDDLQRTILIPWKAGYPFTVSGVLIHSRAAVSEIQIIHTPHPKRVYADIHNSEMHARGIADMATDRRLLPFSKGSDYTHDLLFSGEVQPTETPTPSITTIEQVCRRLPKAARVLNPRSRKGKAPFEIKDEYDVQDLLSAILRSLLKYSVQEDPLPKVANAKAGRADLSIEELGTLIEIKYVHNSGDQKRILEEYSQDLVLYAEWPHLKTLIYLIYNSADLHDPEAFEKLSSPLEINGKKFDVRIVLA